MAVFRVERNQNYTVMSNYHLRDKSLSLKAKGLLSQMLSLPEDWDYTLAGLARINCEGRDAIRAAVSGLEKAGYVTRSRVRNEKGHLQGTEYVIREQPVFSAEPALEEPASGNPTLDDPAQLNKDTLPEHPTRRLLIRSISNTSRSARMFPSGISTRLSGCWRTPAIPGRMAIPLSSKKKSSELCRSKFNPKQQAPFQQNPAPPFG